MLRCFTRLAEGVCLDLFLARTRLIFIAATARCVTRSLLLRHARFGYLRLDTELGRLATSASVRHSVWKRRERSFSLADRVGVALERCPGLPSCWRPARTSRESGLWLALRRDPWNRDQ